MARWSSLPGSARRPPSPPSRAGERWAWRGTRRTEGPFASPRPGPPSSPLLVAPPASSHGLGARHGWRGAGAAGLAAAGRGDDARPAVRPRIRAWAVRHAGARWWRPACGELRGRGLPQSRGVGAACVAAEASPRPSAAGESYSSAAARHVGSGLSPLSPSSRPAAGAPPCPALLQAPSAGGRARRRHCRDSPALLPLRLSSIRDGLPPRPPPLLGASARRPPVPACPGARARAGRRGVASRRPCAAWRAEPAGRGGMASRGRRHGHGEGVRSRGGAGRRHGPCGGGCAARGCWTGRAPRHRGGVAGGR